VQLKIAIKETRNENKKIEMAYSLEYTKILCSLSHTTGDDVRKATTGITNAIMVFKVISATM
jgi:hypothetical protein